MTKGTRILINTKTGKWGKIHHCALCATAMDQRCKKERHFGYCESCGHIFSVLKGCHYHTYHNNFNRDMLKEKRRFAGYTLDSEDEDNPLVYESGSTHDSWADLGQEELDAKLEDQYEKDRAMKASGGKRRRSKVFVVDEEEEEDEGRDGEDGDVGKKARKDKGKKDKMARGKKGKGKAKK